jgi:hypothetical protein
MAAMPKPSLPKPKRIEVFGDHRDEKIKTHLSKGKLEHAEFFCQDRDVYVMFDSDEGSPFESNCFHVYKGKEKGVASGPVKEKGVPIGGAYRYTVRPMTGTFPGADNPEIIITP